MASWKEKSQLAGWINAQGVIAPRLLWAKGVWKPSNVSLSSRDESGGLEFDVPAKFAVLPIEEWGWEKVEKTGTLVEEFLQIETLGEVEYFARRYGPIFVCQEHTDLKDIVPTLCRWTGRDSFLQRDCRWKPHESVDVWLACVRQAVGALRLIARMHAGEHLFEDPEAWRDLMLISSGKEHEDATHQFITSNYGERFAKAYLAAWINGFPRDNWPIRFALNEDCSPRTETGLGFLPIVWSVIARAAGGGRSVQVCSGCNHPYLRPVSSREPKIGQKNYCTKCGKEKGYAVAKKQSGEVRLSRLRRLADFVLMLHSAPLPPQDNMDFLRRAWNNQYPEAAYPTVDRFKRDLILMLRGSYRAVTGDKQRAVRFVMENHLGLNIDDLLAEE